MKKILLFSLTLLWTSIVIGQGTIKGIVVDEQTGEALIGANITVVESSVGTITDLDGKFMIDDLANGMSKIMISYVGYVNKSITVDVKGNVDLGSITLSGDAFGLQEVVVTGVMDIVKDRYTPVAVSTISTAQIQAKAGNIEFPELMKSTPSIYVANQSGGYGDSEVFTRGFDQTNTAFLLNGQPINGMEDGKMYWSNWSGMSDIASAVQVQRGLGASKLAISSVGGTTNIVTKTVDSKKGGSVQAIYGNDNYIKGTVGYSTGLMSNKLAVSMLFSHWQGNGWADGTKGQGQNYFLSIGYKNSEKSTFNFLITGAPQWHDQNYGKRLNDYYVNGELDTKYNSNWGYKGGEYYSMRRNFYHKPIANLSWDLQLNDKSSLSTVLYGSWGRGGGTGPLGARYSNEPIGTKLINFDAIVGANTVLAGTDKGSSIIRRGSMNMHSWYGLVTKYENKLTDKINWSIGVDGRFYHGDHFRQVDDLLGGKFYSQRGTTRNPNGYNVTSTFKSNPWSALNDFAKEGSNERIDYDNAEQINYLGVFTQLEYTQDKYSAYIQGALSSQSHTRYERFGAKAEDEKSKKETNPGFNLKGGFNYNLDDNNSVYFNTGYYSRQPFHDNIFPYNTNVVNTLAVNEKIFGLEAGYKLRMNNFDANLNLYRTSWKDRNFSSIISIGQTVNGVVLDNGGYNLITGIDQLHSGIEIDGKYKATSALTLKGFVSIGDWKFDSKSDVTSFNDNLEQIATASGVDFKGIHVGGAAQTTYSIGADYKLSKGLKIEAEYFNYSRLYSKLNISSSTKLASELELPSYGVVDMSLSYKMDLDGKYLTFRVNVNNILDETYISQATSSTAASSVETENWNGVNKTNFVQFGQGRTWSASVKYAF